MGRRPKNYVPPKPIVTIRCVKCGKDKAETEFYSNKWGKVYVAQKRVPLCKDCVQELFNEYSYEYGEEAAMFLICAALDIPFDNRLTRRTTDKTPPLTVGKYFRQLNRRQYVDSSFAESVTTGGQKCPKPHGANDRLGELQEGVSAMREELHDLRVKLTESGNINKSANDSF